MDNPKLKQEDIEAPVTAMDTKEDKTGQDLAAENAQPQAVDPGALLAAKIQGLFSNRTLARASMEAEGDKAGKAQGLDSSQSQAQADPGDLLSAKIQGPARNRALARATSAIHVHNGVNAHFRARARARALALARDQAPSDFEEHSSEETEGNDSGGKANQRVVNYMSGRPRGSESD